jgi:chromosome segregation ATPase
MILGPNGTGKSSIACAICLGLNWPPSVHFLSNGSLFPAEPMQNQVLGRASELGSFVKMGASQGYIEIELKGPKGQGNFIVRRQLKANSKGSSFTLNGANTTGKEITKRMGELNVQVGNLWYDLETHSTCLYVDFICYQLVPTPRQGLRVCANELVSALAGDSTRCWGCEVD